MLKKNQTREMLPKRRKMMIFSNLSKERVPATPAKGKIFIQLLRSWAHSLTWPTVSKTQLMM